MIKMLKEIHQQPETIKRVLQNAEDIILEIVSELKSKNINKVIIAARGTSDHAAVYGKYIIEYSLGIPVSLAAPSILTIYSKKVNYCDSLVIGISQSGKALDVLEVIKQANMQGAVTIGITNFQDSPIGNEARYHLFTDAGLEESVATPKTFTGQMTMLAMLATLWADDKDTYKQLKKVPANIRKMRNLEKDIEQAVQKYTYIENCFILSRGINYPIALETALKLQETSYIKAQGYAVSDFHHGPFAMIDEHTPVLVFASDGPTTKDSIEMIKKLKKAHAEIVLVSDNQELLKQTDVSFEIPSAHNDIISPFYNIIFGQLFACKLALAKGRNPDSPRGLSKITITK